MRMHSASTAATCRVSLSSGAAVDVVCGGGRFTFRRVTAGADAASGSPGHGCAGVADPSAVKATGAERGGGTPSQRHHSGHGRGDGSAHGSGNGSAHGSTHGRGDGSAHGRGDGSGHGSRNGHVPPSESLPAVMCWVVPSAAARGAGDTCGHTLAVCALVDTGAGSRGTVTSVDVMAAGAGATSVCGWSTASRKEARLAHPGSVRPRDLWKARMHAHAVPCLPVALKTGTASFCAGRLTLHHHHWCIALAECHGGSCMWGACPVACLPLVAQC